MDFDQPPVVRVTKRPDVSPHDWSANIPAVQQILRDYCLDEPEAALSFSSTLGLIRVLADVVAAGGQVVCATHSPVLAAMPGARILEVGPWGLREATWDELELVVHWKAYLDAPMRYLRHTLAED